MEPDNRTTSSVPHLALVTANPVRIGGMQTFTSHLVHACLRGGWKVTVALSGDDIYAPNADDNADRLTVDRVNWIDDRLAGDRDFHWKLINERRRWFRRVRPDVALFVQSSNTPFRASIAGAALAGVPVITTHRTLPWPVESVPSRRHLFGLLPGLGLHRRKVILKTWLTAALAKKTVYNCRAVRRAYEVDYGYPHQKGTVIPNSLGADTPGYGEQPGFPGAGAAIQRDSTTEDRPIRIGYVGRLGREKRVDLLIKAVAALETRRAVRLLIYGEGPERASLQQAAVAAGVEGRIEWRGTVERCEVVWRELDLLVVCSDRESSSNAALEAMAAGVCVVVTRVGGLPELVGHGRCGAIVPPNDPAALTAVLKDLVDNDQARARLATMASVQVRREHDPAGVDRAWLTLLGETAGRRGKPRKRQCDTSDAASAWIRTA